MSRLFRLREPGLLSSLFLLALFTYLAVMRSCGEPAYARAPAYTDPDLAPWFEEQFIGEDPGASCCGIADAHMLSPRQWRPITITDKDGKPAASFEVNIADPGEPDNWVTVGLDRIKYTENPTGVAVAWWMKALGNLVICFRPPAGF